MSMIPDHVRPLFWDTNVETFDPQAHPAYTIERVLEHGDEPEVGWLLRTFTEDQIRDVIRTSRRLSPRSANFWALVFGVSRHDVPVLTHS